VHRPSLAASSDAAHLEPNSAKRSSIVLPQQSSAPDEAPHLVTTFTWDQFPTQFSDSFGVTISASSHLKSNEESSSDETDQVADDHRKNQIIAGINARVASERHHKQMYHSASSTESSGDEARLPSSHEKRAQMAQHLSAASVPSAFDSGKQLSKVRPRLRIPSGFERSRARVASRNEGSDSFSKPEFSRHLLGGSFEQRHSQHSGLARNRYNQTAEERPSVLVRFVATLSCVCLISSI
jgi:hypothetical protein